ncbi:uncharacterized protein LOC144624782 [Crassostrea virginica]
MERRENYDIDEIPVFMDIDLTLSNNEEKVYTSSEESESEADEISAVDSIRDSSDIECISHHQTFIDNRLNLRVLEVSLYDYIQSEGPLDDNEPINEFVLWVWRRLGEKHRKSLPACVVSKIRDTLPSELCTDFQYTRPVD